MKKTKTIISSVIAATTLMSACSVKATPNETVQTQPETAVVASQETTATSVLGAERESEAEQSTNTGSSVSAQQEGTPVEDVQALFKEISGINFRGATGHGGLQTEYWEMTINEDGTFDFFYFKDNSESKTEWGLAYEANGTFGNVTKIGDLTYSVEVLDITPKHQVGEIFRDNKSPIDYEAIDCDYIMVGDIFTYYQMEVDSSTLPSNITTDYRIYRSSLPEKFDEYCIYNTRNDIGFLTNVNAQPE